MAVLQDRRVSDAFIFGIIALLIGICKYFSIARGRLITLKPKQKR